MLDYRFPTALQMVLSVAMAEQLGERSTSAILAYGLEANPSFIRKLMVPLTRDGIIVSTLGRNGLALGAMAVTAGVVGHLIVFAARAAQNMPPQRRGAALLDC